MNISFLRNFPLQNFSDDVFQPWWIVTQSVIAVTLTFYGSSNILRVDTLLAYVCEKLLHCRTANFDTLVKIIKIAKLIEMFVQLTT